MKTSTVIRKVLLPALLGASLLGTAAQAQVRFNITNAPPAPQYEVVPTVAPGYVWAPGYWAWHGDRHIWVHGRSIVQRPGYRWEPDRWEQRKAGYYRYPGVWTAETQRPGPPMKKPKKQKKAKQEKYEEGRG